MLYAFGYLRVSTEEQTILNQRIAIKKWASDNDYEILEFFEDASVSGKVQQSTDRPSGKCSK
jgi:DNA invertase Pin-like site-specific DNA recombinase